jgi:hypothetical protein
MDWSSVYVRWDLEALLEGQTVAVAVTLRPPASPRAIWLEGAPSAHSANSVKRPTPSAGG